MNKYDVFIKLMKKYKKDPSIYGILLLGKASYIKKEEFDSLNDIDICLIDCGKNFEREICLIENAKFDISYISLEVIKNVIENKNYNMIKILSNSKMIYYTNEEVVYWIDEVKNMYNNGPVPISSEEVKYIRFKLNEMYEDLLNRIDDSLNFSYLSYNLFNISLKYYFKLNNIWIPKDKKILKKINEIDSELYDLCTSFLSIYDLNIKLEILSNIISYITKQFGGVLKIINKDLFPIDE